MRKVIAKTSLLAAGAGLLLGASAGCKLALYPLARAFGGMPERELASCRVHFRELQASLPKARLTIHPPCVIKKGGGQWDASATGLIAEALRAKGFEDVVAEDSLPGVPVEVPGHNQLLFETRRAHAYSAWVWGAKLGPGWHLFSDFVVSGDRLTGFGIYVTDADGGLALLRIMNVHQEGFEGVRPGSIESGYRALVKGLLLSLKMSPERLFPPYGVG
jgi:hypothetical protein